MIYTGIGSRETPEDVLDIMKLVGRELLIKGHILRSGAAPGADHEFELGASSANSTFKYSIQDRVEIYLPWKSFEKDKRTWIEPRLDEPNEDAFPIAEHYHPRWKYLSQGAKRLHARNVHQIFGPNVLEPVYSDFVICWTSDGKASGGTGQALRIAKDKKIKIYNLYNEDEYDSVIDMVT